VAGAIVRQYGFPSPAFDPYLFLVDGQRDSSWSLGATAHVFDEPDRAVGAGGPADARRGALAQLDETTPVLALRCAVPEIRDDVRAEDRRQRDILEQHG